MFQQPKRTEFSAPPVEIDVDERYLFKVVKLIDKGISSYVDPAKGEDWHDIDWVFNVARYETRAPIYNDDGSPWEYVDGTTSKIGRNPKNGMVAKARLWIEAFLGHGVETDEITAQTPQQLVGKYATGFFENKEIQAKDGTTYTKLKIMRLSPYKAGAPVEPKPEPKPEPAAAAEPALPF